MGIRLAEAVGLGAVVYVASVLGLWLAAGRPQGGRPTRCCWRADAEARLIRLPGCRLALSQDFEGLAGTSAGIFYAIDELVITTQGYYHLAFAP